MGDFEDVFGADADTDKIIDAYNREYVRASPIEKARWFGEPDPDKLQKAIEQEEFDDWSKKMNRAGYVRKASFNTYQELDTWMRNQKGSDIVSRRTHFGFVAFVKRETKK